MMTVVLDRWGRLAFDDVGNGLQTGALCASMCRLDHVVLDLDEQALLAVS